MKKSMGLKKSVLITVIAVTTVMLLCVSVIGYIISYNKVSETLTVETEQALLVCAEQVNAWLGEQGDFAVSQANAAGNIGYFVSEHTRNDEFIDSVMLLNSALLDCYTAYEDVSLYMAVTDTSTLPEGFDATSRAWYQSAKAQNKAIYTAPYVDTATGAMIFTVAAPIRENGTFAGVFGCDITLDTVIQLVSKMKLSENGYPVLIDGDGNFLVHSNSSYMPTKDNANEMFKDREQKALEKIITLLELKDIDINDMIKLVETFPTTTEKEKEYMISRIRASRTKVVRIKDKSRTEDR